MIDFAIENFPKYYESIERMDNWGKMHFIMKKIFRENLIEKAEKEFNISRCFIYKN